MRRNLIFSTIIILWWKSLLSFLPGNCCCKVCTCEWLCELGSFPSETYLNLFIVTKMALLDGLSRVNNRLLSTNPTSPTPFPTILILIRQTKCSDCETTPAGYTSSMGRTGKFFLLLYRTGKERKLGGKFQVSARCTQILNRANCCESCATSPFALWA